MAAGVALVEHDGRLLLARRPPTGLLGGLWEPVIVPTAHLDALDATLLARGVRERVGLQISVGPKLGRVVHVFSHRRLTADVFQARVEGGTLSPNHEAYVEAQWCASGEEPALSTLARKLLALRRALPLWDCA